MSALDRLGLSDGFYQDTTKHSEAQEQTKNTFGFKWSRRETYESEAMKRATRDWLVERYCNNDPTRIRQWLDGSERKIILDAGCGSGYSALLLFGDNLRRHDYLGVDISDSVHVGKLRFAEASIPADFLQASITDLPFPPQSIDIIFSEGVLHHTDNTQKAIEYLSTKLKVGGLFLFYVYKKKAVIREFTDDYVREQLQQLTDAEAWEALKPLTKLGASLGRLETDIVVEDDIPFLGIKKGKLDLQRFFYWNICKAYYKPEYTLEELNHINFDWFRPLNCHRHTQEEIEEFCYSAGLSIEHMNVQDSGITVVARKRAVIAQ